MAFMSVWRVTMLRYNLVGKYAIPKSGSNRLVIDAYTRSGSTRLSMTFLIVKPCTMIEKTTTA